MSHKVLKPLLGKSELLLFIFSLQTCATQCKGFSMQQIQDTFMFSLRSQENGYKCRFSPQANPGPLAASIGCILTFSAQHLT